MVAVTSHDTGVSVDNISWITPEQKSMIFTTIVRGSLIVTLVAFGIVRCVAQEWTTLKGRVVVTDTIPAPTKLDITRDENVCGKFNLVDESLIINPKNNGLQNVVIWLSSKKPVPVHPSLADLPKPVQLDNKDCRFQPRVVKLRTKQILQSTNADPVAHNVAVYARRNQPFSIVVPEDKPLERSFDREELMPIRVDCSIHAWMRAYLVITEHPYSAVTDKDGKFSIPKIPQGEWEFRIWHERSGYFSQPTIDGKTAELKRGTVTLQLSGEQRDLGELVAKAAEFTED